jgi:hypothetical protein
MSNESKKRHDAMSATAPVAEPKEAQAQAPPPRPKESALDALTVAGSTASPDAGSRAFAVGFVLLALVLQLGWIAVLTWLGWQIVS